MSKKIRLSKILSQSGVASRRAAEELIFARKVKVNGVVVDVPQTLCSFDSDIIEVNGQKIKKEEYFYFAFHKPQGVICSCKKVNRTHIVLDFFEEIDARLFPVGRLDKDTTGLLILTNDGHFANKIIHPSRGIDKEYLVKVQAEITEDHLSQMREGVVVEGVKVVPKKVTHIRKGTLKIVVGEGKKHEVRKIVEASGLTVHQLSRIRIGSLLLGTLPIGKWRPLTFKEREQFNGF